MKSTQRPRPHARCPGCCWAGSARVGCGRRQEGLHRALGPNQGLRGFLLPRGKHPDAAPYPAKGPVLRKMSIRNHLCGCGREHCDFAKRYKTRTTWTKPRRQNAKFADVRHLPQLRLIDCLSRNGPTWTVPGSPDSGNLNRRGPRAGPRMGTLSAPPSLSLLCQSLRASDGPATPPLCMDEWSAGVNGHPRDKSREGGAQTCASALPVALIGHRPPGAPVH